MKKLELYNKSKTYAFPTGALASPEVVAERYPATKLFTHVVETDPNGQVMFSLTNLSVLRARYNVADSLSVEDAIVAIEAEINKPTNILPTPEERIAAALEYQNLLAMEDVL